MTLSRKLIMSATLLVPTLLVYFVMAQRLPMTADDYSYLYQAKLFASGKLYAEDRLYDPGLPFHDCLQTSCMKDDQGHRFSKYAPGWPLILSVGVKLGVPWIVDPLLGVLLFFLMLRYTERRLGEKSVRVVYGLVLLCFFFAYYAASKLRLLTAGALLGCSAMIRYIDWIPLAVWIGVGLLRRKRFADLLLFGIGFALFASGNLVYNKLLTGDPFIVPAGLYHSSSDTSDRLLISLKGFSVTAGAALGRPLETLLAVSHNEDVPCIVCDGCCRLLLLYRSLRRPRTALFSCLLPIFGAGDRRPLQVDQLVPFTDSALVLEPRNRSASCLQHRVCVEGSIHHVRATRSRAYCATRSGWKEYLLAEDPGASHRYRRSDSKSTRAGFSREPFF